MSKSNNNNNKRGGGGLLNQLAFFAVVFLAIVMIVNAVLGLINHCFDTNISLKFTGILTQIAFAIAIAITVIASYPAAKGKGKGAFVVWVVSAILVVLSYVLGITIL